MNYGPYVRVRSPDAFELALKQCKSPCQEAIVRGFLDMHGEWFLGHRVNHIKVLETTVDSLQKAMTYAGVKWFVRVGNDGETILVLDGIGMR